MATDKLNAGLAIRRTVDGEFIEQLERPALAVELGLEPHPEGGWYRRTWTSPVTLAITDDDGAVRSRPTATLISFLLPAGESSAWHRVTSTEIWIWNGQGTVSIEFGGTGDSPAAETAVILGGNLLLDESTQVIIPGGVWQRTLLSNADALVSCVVSPGFDFDDFSLAST